MTDMYGFSNDTRPRPTLRIDVHSAHDDDVSFSLDDPTAENVAQVLVVVERLAGSLLHQDGAS